MKRNVTIGDKKGNTFEMVVDYNDETNDYFNDIIYNGGGHIESIRCFIPNNITEKDIDFLNFTSDWEKMYDFWRCNKAEFLDEYTYISEKEYDCTCLKTIFGIIEPTEYPSHYYR